MDDEKFKAELLSRMDRIISLLSASCSMSKTLLERSYPDALKPKQQAQGEAPPHSGQYLLRDEMADDYNEAIEKWKSGKGSG